MKVYGIFNVMAFYLVHVKIRDQSAIFARNDTKQKQRSAKRVASCDAHSLRNSDQLYSESRHSADARLLKSPIKIAINDTITNTQMKEHVLKLIILNYHNVLLNVLKCLKVVKKPETSKS